MNVFLFLSSHCFTETVSDDLITYVSWYFVNQSLSSGCDFEKVLIFEMISSIGGCYEMITIALPSTIILLKQRDVTT